MKEIDDRLTSGNDLSGLAVAKIDDGTDGVDEGRENENRKPSITRRRNQFGSQRTADNA